uniref:DUF4283 domain-containing protein n=1 Tax=Cannabis sativa TaxID=3483 RepID=A0A803PK93_CANSA
MTSSSHTPNSLSALADEESVVHEFDHISLNHPNDSNSFCLIFKLLTSKTVNPAWIEKAMTNAWTLCFPYQISEYHSGLFLATFQCDGDRRRVLEEQPWHFDKFLIVFTHPDVSPTPTPATVRYVPFWVQAHNIPFGRKSPQLAQFIADEIGLPSFCYFCGLMDHTYNKCAKYLLRCDNFPGPPSLEYKETLRATTPAHLKKNPFEISNSTPFEEYFPRSTANDQGLQQAVDQFLRMDSPVSRPDISTTCFTHSPVSFPPLFTHTTIPPPIMTTSVITHTDKGKGIVVTISSPPRSHCNRSTSLVINEPRSVPSPVLSSGTRRPFTRQTAQVGDSVRSMLKRARAVSSDDAVVPSLSDDVPMAGVASRPRQEK